MNEFAEVKEMHEFLLKEIKETKIYCKGCKNQQQTILSIFIKFIRFAIGIS